MPISINPLNSPYQTTLSSLRTDSRTAGMSGSTPSYDEITINASPQQTERKFANTLVNALTAELRTPTKADRLNELENQIRSNTYQISPETIASKILMTDGGSHYE